MSITLYKIKKLGAVCGAVAALAGSALLSPGQPAMAQRGAPPRAGSGIPPVKRAMTADTGKKTSKADTAKKAPPAVSLDFQDQELKTVLDALAAAGDLNVSLTNIPSQRISVHMGRPVTREGMIEV